jgi:gamma-glutamyltranspeptidase / glutathione hydrolase
MTVWRPAVMGRNGVVASAHPAASLAGLKVLMDGGNAVDAVVAVASTLNVVEPYMSGLGGSGLMLITTPGRATPVVINYTGGAPAGIKPDELTKDDLTKGPKSPEVPGAPAGWYAEHGIGLPTWSVGPEVLNASCEGSHHRVRRRIAPSRHHSPD